MAAMRESDIMQMITSDQSWEQIIQEIITSEGLDPWNLDVGRLSDSFAKHISKMETLDFKVPAKYVIIAAVMLRMKSDDLQLLDFGREPEDGFEPELAGPTLERIEVSPLTLPPRRLAHRKIVVDDLISALRRVLATQERRETREHIRPSIELSDFDIEERINGLYSKITMLMGKDAELKFSEVVPKWEREHIIDAFMPLMHLDNARKLNCRQEEFFKDIFIGKVDNGLRQEAPAEPVLAGGSAAKAKGTARVKAKKKR
jgi:chromatin segregation and condensation protein Rec8/ScpA/Scc1 (kleisin family)